jgi:hypothetical protein
MCATSDWYLRPNGRASPGSPSLLVVTA